tara:strand:- start:1447 stop:1923 length:477 start_codon:yes stop_codon:yes gene_type:complete
MNIFKLILTISLIFVSCSKNGIENEIKEYVLSVEELIERFPNHYSKYYQHDLYINSTNGGNISVSIQDRVINESELGQGKQVLQNARLLDYHGKFVGSYNTGTSITITAKANQGFNFVGWTGLKCHKYCATPFASDESSITLIIDSRLLFTANFDKIP